MSYCNNLLDLNNPMLTNAKAFKIQTWRTLSLVGSLLITALFTVLGTQPAYAKFEDYLTKRWFGIEVIVFERSNIDDKNTLEALASPRLTPDVDEAIDSSTLISEPLTTTNPNDLLEVETAITGAREPTEQRLALETQLFGEDTTKETIRVDFLEAINAFEQELESRNLIFKADANPRLEDELQRLQRPRNNSVIWRGNWLQAVPKRDAPEPLEIAVNELESGEFQLTGSIEVTVNRYLHLHAQLLYHDPAFGHELGADFATQGITGSGATAGQPQSNLRQTASAANGSAIRPGSTRFDDQALAPALNDQSLIEQQRFEPLFMVLDETRRMRSGFLHYLDHPKLGLLVRIDKITVPEELLAQYKMFEASQK